eukprot:TRINITY_DN26476_c0_g1_i1.p1 TRINITY_DN26476_c0_g1~~TRINITY_DN26476_c0_g1_i1.p1  ORF type:complete len:581 (-),score=112.06 TRINITY_DN26476_c0_g1_i1:935-2677(-)
MEGSEDEKYKDFRMANMRSPYPRAPSAPPPPLSGIPGVQDAGRKEEEEAQAGMSWRMGRGLLACVYVGVLLTVLVLSSAPVAFGVAWLMAPGSYQSSHSLQFDYRRQDPMAEVQLLSPKEWAKVLAVVAKRPGKPVTGPHLVPRGQGYRVYLELALPESDHNRRLGMFQVSAESSAVTGEILASSSVPCMLRWRHRIVRTARLLIFAVPLLLGWHEEHQKMRLLLLKALEGQLPLAAVRIFLEPKAGLPPPLGLPELYSAKLRVESFQPGILGWLPFGLFTTTVWVLLLLLALELSCMLCCCRWALFPQLGSKAPPRPTVGVPRDVAVAHHLASAAEKMAEVHHKDDELHGQEDVLGEQQRDLGLDDVDALLGLDSQEGLGRFGGFGEDGLNEAGEDDMGGLVIDGEEFGDPLLTEEVPQRAPLYPVIDSEGLRRRVPVSSADAEGGERWNQTGRGGGVPHSDYWASQASDLGRHGAGGGYYEEEEDGGVTGYRASALSPYREEQGGWDRPMEMGPGAAAVAPGLRAAVERELDGGPADAERESRDLITQFAVGSRDTVASVAGSLASVFGGEEGRGGPR